MEANQELTTTTLERLQQASGAWYRSDSEPYSAMWSRREPVSLFGALGPAKTGWPEVEVALRWVMSRFSDPDITTDFEVVHVGSELAYTVGYEQGQVAINGTRRPVKVRVTHIYRREQDEWKLIHRHGDFAPVDDSPSVARRPRRATRELVGAARRVTRQPMRICSATARQAATEGRAR